jgi:hypothetical protein
MTNQWKKVRVVVEVPARADVLTERSLAQSVKEAISLYEADHSALIRTKTGEGVGAPRVLEYSRLTRAEFGAVISAREIEKHQRAIGDSNLALARLAAESAFRSCEKGNNLQFAMARIEELLTGEPHPITSMGQNLIDQQVSRALRDKSALVTKIVRVGERKRRK